MKKRTLIIIATSAVLLSLCGLMIFIGLMTARSIDIRPDRLFHVNTFWVEGDDSKSVKISGPLELEVHNTSGKVDIQAADDGEVKVEIHKRAGGITQQVAQENLESIQVDVSKTGNLVVVDATGDDNWSLAYDEFSVDLTIYVPKTSSVNVADRFGDVELSGIEGDAEIDSDFGSLFVSDINGSLTAVLETGDIIIEEIDAASGFVDVSTDFGNVTLKSGHSALCTVSSNNGEIDIDDVDVDGDIRADSSFGSIQLNNVQAEDIIINSSNGDISLIDVEAKKKIEVSTSYGDITVDRGKTIDYQLTSMNGLISCNEISGNLQIESDFGDADLKNCQADKLKFNSKNGSLDYLGRLGDGPHFIDTDFGDIDLVLPEDTSLSLDMKTDFGKFETNFDLHVTGELDGEHWVGKIGGGDVVLEARTNNGDIIINKIEDNQ